MKRDGVDAPAAVRPGDTHKRLSALVRRHGGTPTSFKPINGKVVLPDVPKWGQCEGQDELPLFAEEASE